MTRRTPILLLAAAVLVALAAPALAAESAPLKVFPNPRILPLTMLFFVVIAFPANKLFFQPILRVLDRRRERIEGARTQAQTLSSEAEEILSRYEGAVERARREAEEERRHLLEEARQEQVRITTVARGDAEQEVSRARHEVGSALQDARSKLREETQRLGREAASRVLGRELA